MSKFNENDPSDIPELLIEENLPLNAGNTEADEQKFNVIKPKHEELIKNHPHRIEIQQCLKNLIPDLVKRIEDGASKGASLVANQIGNNAGFYWNNLKIYAVGEFAGRSEQAKGVIEFRNAKRKEEKEKKALQDKHESEKLHKITSEHIDYNTLAAPLEESKEGENMTVTPLGDVHIPDSHSDIIS